MALRRRVPSPLVLRPLSGIAGGGGVSVCMGVHEVVLRVDVVVVVVVVVGVAWDTKERPRTSGNMCRISSDARPAEMSCPYVR